MDILSRLDLYERGRRYVLTHARKIEATIVDTLGSDVNIFVGSMAFVGHAISRQLVRSVKDLLLRTAEKEGLDRYIFDRYQEKRKGAAPARGSVMFTRGTATIGSGTIPAGTKLLTLTGLEYITTSEATFGASTLVVSDVGIRAVQAGKAFQVGKNFVRKFHRQSEIFDTTITVTNPLATAGGEDAEDDDVFRERMRDFWRTARRGTLGAIEFGARAVPGVESAQAVEALTGSAQPARVVQLYIADGSGVASKELGDEVLTNLDDYRAAGIAVLPSLSVPQIVSVQLRLAFKAGVETAILSLTIRTAVVEFINSLGANQTLIYKLLGALLSRYQDNGLVLEQSEIVEPAGDLVPSAGFTLRTTLKDVVLV